MIGTRVAEILGDTQLSLLWICAIAATLVFIALVYSTLMFRPADVARRDVPRKARELVWALVPIVIVIAAAAPAVSNSGATQNTRLNLIAESHVAPCTMALTESTPAQLLRTVAATPCSKRH